MKVFSFILSQEIHMTTIKLNELSATLHINLFSKFKNKKIKKDTVVIVKNNIQSFLLFSKNTNNK